MASDPAAIAAHIHSRPAPCIEAISDLSEKFVRHSAAYAPATGYETGALCPLVGTEIPNTNDEKWSFAAYGFTYPIPYKRDKAAPMMKQSLFVVSALLLTSCVSSTRHPYVADRLPKLDELNAFIKANWSNDYGKRFARASSKPGESPQFISVGEVTCGYYFVTPQCDFVVVAQFPGEKPRPEKFRERFGWNQDDALEAVFVVYDRKK